MFFGTFCRTRQKVQEKVPEAPAQSYISETMKHSNSEDELFGTFCLNRQNVKNLLSNATRKISCYQTSQEKILVIKRHKKIFLPMIMIMIIKMIMIMIMTMLMRAEFFCLEPVEKLKS